MLPDMEALDLFIPGGSCDRDRNHTNLLGNALANHQIVGQFEDQESPRWQHSRPYNATCLPPNRLSSQRGAIRAPSSLGYSCNCSGLYHQ